MPISNSTDRFNGVLASLAIKVRCVAGVEADVPSLSSLSNPYSGVTVADGDRVLLTAQTDPIENGIWVVSETSAWTRPADWDGNRDLIYGTVIFAGQATGADKTWQVQTAGIITPGTSAVTLAILQDPNSVQSNPILLAELANSNADISGFGQFWVNNNGLNPAEAYFTNENGDDQSLTRELWHNAVLKAAATALGLEVTNILTLLGGGSLMISELAGAAVDVADQGQFWVRDDDPNVPMFTDDGGGDQLIDPSVSEINVQNAAYELVLADKGKTIHKVTSTASITVTIPANASVAFPIGTLIAFKNSGTEDWDVAITSDTMTDTTGVTGTQILVADEIAVIQKLTATTWGYAATPPQAGGGDVTASGTPDDKYDIDVTAAVTNWIAGTANLGVVL